METKGDKLSSKETTNTLTRLLIRNNWLEWSVALLFSYGKERFYQNDPKFYQNDPKFSDIKVCANSADPDQTAPREAVWSKSSLFAIPFESFWQIPKGLASMFEI